MNLADTAVLRPCSEKDIRESFIQARRGGQARQAGVHGCVSAQSGAGTRRILGLLVDLSGGFAHPRHRQERRLAGCHVLLQPCA